MVVCKYFQQGSCRFGRNCRFEHVYSNKYSYNANQAPSQPPPPSAVTDEQLVAQVMSDVQSLLQGKQWVLTSYAPFKDKPNFPGFQDLSFEEARLFIYEAKANNTLDNAISYFNHLIQEARLKYDKLLHPTPNIIRVLRSLYNGETPHSPFENQPTMASNNSSNAAASIFRSAAQGTSVFGQSNPTSVFGQPSQPFGQQSQPFGQPTQPFGQAPTQPSSNIFGSQAQPAQSIFAQANQSIFGQANQQANQAQPSSNLFASAAQNTFGTNNQSSSPFANVFQQQNKQLNNQSATASPFPNVFQQENKQTNVFGGSQAPTNIFAQGNAPNNFPSSVFGQANASIDESSIYSKLEDLGGDDVDMFKSDEFKLGFIPELPPPKSLCS